MTSLADLTTLRLGGPAKRLVTAYDEAEVVDVVRGADGAGEPLLVLGGGSNVVLPDEGFDGTVLRVANHGLAARRDGDRVRPPHLGWGTLARPLRRPFRILLQLAERVRPVELGPDRP